MSRVAGRVRFLGSAGLIAALAFTAAPITGDVALAQPPSQAADCVPLASAEQLKCSVTYLAVGGAQEFVVPDEITSLEIELVGGNGGSVGSPRPGVPGALGGSGARVSATIPNVTPGESLLVMVGGNGNTSADNPGGFNGGGASGASAGSVNRIAGGGGATDVRRIAGDLSSCLAVAGGGGGAITGGAE